MLYSSVKQSVGNSGDVVIDEDYSHYSPPIRPLDPKIIRYPDPTDPDTYYD
jgi:hypothetical protein